MRGLTLEAIEAKAMDFQTAQAIAHRYSRVFRYAPQQSMDAQAAARQAGMAARRYLWAAIERKRQIDVTITGHVMYVASHDFRKD